MIEIMVFVVDDDNVRYVRFYCFQGSLLSIISFISPSCPTLIIQLTIQLNVKYKIRIKQIFIWWKSLNSLPLACVGQTLLYAFVTSSLNYINVFLYGLLTQLIKRLQYVQNLAATPYRVLGEHHTCPSTTALASI